MRNLSANVLLAATNPTPGQSSGGRGFETGDFVEILVRYDGVGGFASLQVDVDLGAVAGNLFEADDGVWVEYQFDGGPWLELIAFRPGPGGGGSRRIPTVTGKGMRGLQS